MITKPSLISKDNTNISKLVPSIKKISYRKILNSRVEFTNEFIIELSNGCCGVGSSPRGETISIYEEKTSTIDPREIVEATNRYQYCNVPLDQKRFDDYLQRKMHIFGRNNCYALSLAFFNATNKSLASLQRCKEDNVNAEFPNLCINVLNGGKHAYTNPVLSDFHEYLLVSKSNDLGEIIRDHNKIQNEVREKLITKNQIVVNNNLVNKFDTVDNRECIELLLSVLESLNLSDKYDLMIDAAGTDLWTGQGYRFSVTDNSLKTGDELCRYWMDLIEEYNIKFLEDPFHEKDYESLERLTTTQNQCNIIGDDIYSGDAQRIEEGSIKKYTNGVVLKPNQAGTVSALVRAIEAVQSNGQILIMSHRSISTESTFLATITCMYKAKYIKIGPLCTDYSSIIRLNELIRLTDREP